MNFSREEYLRYCRSVSWDFTPSIGKLRSRRVEISFLSFFPRLDRSLLSSSQTRKKFHACTKSRKIFRKVREASWGNVSRVCVLIFLRARCARDTNVYLYDFRAEQRHGFLTQYSRLLRFCSSDFFVDASSRYLNVDSLDVVDWYSNLAWFLSDRFEKKSDARVRINSPPPL